MRGLWFGADFSSSKPKNMMVKRSPALAKVGRGAVKDDVAGAAFAGDRVGLEPVAVGHVAADNALEREEAHLVHQVMVNGEAALVFDVGIGHQRPV